MRRRRTTFKFTATCPGEFAPRKVRVLSYTREQAIETLVDRGYTDIQEVRKPRAADATFVISEAALAEAKRLLGITWPVAVTVKHSEAHNGVCRTNFRERWHRITICPNMDPVKASIVLWHELGHAAYDEQQTEHYGGGSTAAAMLRQQKRRYAYDNRPCEKFARMCEAHHTDHFPLTRGA